MRVSGRSRRSWTKNSCGRASFRSPYQHDNRQWRPGHFDARVQQHTFPRGSAGVVGYVASLNGIGSGGTAAADPTPLSADAERGRQLFSDAVRSFARCSTCHEVTGIGIAVSTPTMKIPMDVPALRQLATPLVMTATTAEDSMPGLVVSNTSRATIYYDLSTLPPVLRMAEPGTVKFASGSPWQHASVSALTMTALWRRSSRTCAPWSARSCVPLSEVIVFSSS